MANFNTHFNVAAGFSFVLSTGLLAAQVATPETALLYFAAGTLGGLLPDIDLSYSVPVRWVFTLTALICVFIILFRYAHYSMVELLLLGTLVYVTIAYGVRLLFAWFTVHRGVIHSIPAALLACFLVAIAAEQFHATPLVAWLTGMMVGIGYLVHLSLDEMYSVNLVGMTLKSSFGTALSFGKSSSPQALVATMVLYIALFGSFFLTPSLKPLQQALTNPPVYRQIHLLPPPGTGWFQGLLPANRLQP